MPLHCLISSSGSSAPAILAFGRSSEVDCLSWASNASR
jgi:hypothetical protein